MYHIKFIILIILSDSSVALTTFAVLSTITTNHLQNFASQTETVLLNNNSPLHNF